MKSLTYFTIVAALVFGMNLSNVNAASKTEKVTVEDPAGYAQAYYNETSQVLTLRMIVPEGRDRVVIYLSDRRGNVVYKDKTIVSTRGAIVEIPMADLSEGNYFLRVKGSQITYSMRIKHK